MRMRTLALNLAGKKLLKIQQTLVRMKMTTLRLPIVNEPGTESMPTIQRTVTNHIERIGDLLPSQTEETLVEDFFSIVTLTVMKTWNRLGKIILTLWTMK
uniref:Uncharacterized protein n=1 Tax=Cacopsylla melanoneura TaxID=428564 RepID=A0A8D8Q801_9HEMI